MPDTPEEQNANTRKPGTFTSESARKAAEASAAARRAKRQAREDSAEEDARTFRQRLGVALSKLTQHELDERVKQARPTELVRFADQAFGKPQPAEEDAPADRDLGQLSREERATLAAMLEGADPDAELSALAQQHEHSADDPSEH